MNNITCCVLKLHAKPQFSCKIICDKNTSCPANRFRNHVPYYRREQRFPGLLSMIVGRIPLARHYAVRRIK
jgi:hypothetical protein